MGIVDPVIQCNSYFAHSENLLLFMMTDERPHIREMVRITPPNRPVVTAVSSQPTTVSSMKSVWLTNEVVIALMMLLLEPLSDEF